MSILAKLYAGIALILVTLLGAWWMVHSLEARGAAQCKAAVAAAVESANARAQSAADDFAAWKLTHQPKTTTITKRVHDAIQADPDCSGKPLPAQLHDALSAAGQSEDSRIPDGPVPSASAANP